MLKKISLVILIVFYIVAGCNHFYNPNGYYILIPPYLPFHYAINIMSGIAEIVCGILLIFSTTRKIAAYGIIILLILFIPAHVYMIQKNGCMSPTFCFPAWVAWLRLIPGQLILIAWAFWYIKK